MSFITREYKFDQSITSTAAAASHEMQHKKQQHIMAMRSLKKLIKPLLRLIKKKQLLKKTLAEFQAQNAYNSSLEDMRKDPIAQVANDDNLANEALEQSIYHEIRHCAEGAAVIVRQEGPVAEQRIVPVHPKQKYIPVHFARTASGTFFWTSMDAVDERQRELHLRQQLDRWGQA